MSVFDWRKGSSGLKTRPLSFVKELLEGGKVVEVTDSGVVVETLTGERVWFGASGYEYDMELYDGR